MHGELVAIDLETTGLDPHSDAIIEIGAVRLRDGQIIDRYETLVNPDRPIPLNVTHLTSIRSEDVEHAPRMQQVIPAVRAFIGKAPIIGHNVIFDATFLQQHGVAHANPRIDTYDLATVLLPAAPRYNLNSLTSLMQIQLDDAHRALADAQAAGLLYYALWARLLELPHTTLAEIADYATDFAWDTRIVFEAAMREHLNRGVGPATTRLSAGDLFGTPAQPTSSLKAAAEPVQLEASSIIDMMTTQLPDKLPGYQVRSQQLAMVQTIVRAFNESGHAMIEAGTGTGKSLAYLMPAILWAVQNNERVVISTNTINLQDQLLEHDIPLLREALGVDFKATVMKGRGQYLCPNRLEAVRTRRPTSIDELRTVAKILVWLPTSHTGDRGEINLRGPLENITWRRLSAEDEGCALDRCQTTMDGICPFFKARMAAEGAHLLIVNHALLIADAKADNRVLPDYRYLIIDEAHHLEDATTSGLSRRLDEATLRRRLADLGGPERGLLGSVLRTVRAHSTERDIRRLEPFVGMLHEAATYMQTHIGSLFGALAALARDHTGDHTSQVRITNKQRNQASFAQVQQTWNTLSEFFEVVSSGMSKLTRALEKLRQDNSVAYENLISSSAALAHYLQDVHDTLQSFALSPDPNLIYWLHVAWDSDNLSLHTAPLHVGSLLADHLWSNKETVILTSATLQTGGSFDFMRERLQADSFETQEVGSPFDYRRSTLLYIPTDLPDPGDRNAYQRAVEQALIALAAALEGRVMALFTSYTQLRQTAQAIAPRLALGNITVYDQSDGSSRQALLDGFKASERAVLLATRSFWEGVDIPGESLSALVIMRLPFTVPTDPVFAARAETYSNSFNDYTLPDAMLRFRQGFGRLIRSQTDRGIVTVFDNRITKKSYGKHFIAALPDCTVERGSVLHLPEAAQNWLDRGNV